MDLRKKTLRISEVRVLPRSHNVPHVIKRHTYIASHVYLYVSQRWPILSIHYADTTLDILTVSIVLYGSPIVTPNMSILKHMGNVAKHNKNSNSTSNPSLLRKISLLNCEKVHLHFMKWALGVNRKASNCGVWGESGRYPLIFERINLTLKYFERLQKLNNNSLVELAFREQRQMNLDWYKGIESVLRVDPCYTADHVTAYNNLSIKSSHQTSTPISQSQHITTKEDFLIHNGFKRRLPSQTVKPLLSEIFTKHVIIKSLKFKFKESWSSAINASSKLEFYKKIKQEFTKESYLDLVQNYYDRIHLTRLRISAHRLEVELGRWHKTPRPERK